MSAPYKAKVHIPWLKNIGGKTYTLKLDLENPKPFGVRGATAENRARGDVGRAGGREPHNHSHWPRWTAGPAARCRKFRRGSFLLNLPSHHSITSSARASSVSGTVRPSALAVLTLMTSSNVLGCSTGISAGFAPRRILSTNSAARRHLLGQFGP